MTIVRISFMLTVVILLHSGVGRADTAVFLEDESASERLVMPLGDWSFDDGMLRQADPGVDGAIAWLRGVQYGDLEISVDFRVHAAGRGVRAAGIVFRAQDPHTLYYIHFDTRSKNILWVRSTPAKRGTDVRRYPCPALTQGTWHRARLKVAGKQHDLWLDGTHVFTETDETHLSGAIGLRTGQGRVDFRDLSVEGIPTADSLPFVPRQPSWRPLCTDAGAGEYEAFPDVCRLANGDLFCVFYAGYGHVSVPNDDLPEGARIASSRSTDAGQTWQFDGVVVDTPIDDRDPSVALMPNGDVVVTFMTYAPKRSEGTHQAFSVRSTDDGQSWSEPTPIDTPFTQLEAISSPPRVLDDGRVLQCVYGNNTGDPRRYKHSAILQSTDQARTWETLSEIRSDEFLLLEPDVVSLPNDRLLMLMRPSMAWSESLDGGRTWSPPQAVGIRGDCPYLLYTSDGILLCGIRHRPTRSTVVIWSTDEGRSWQGPFTVDRVLGAYPSLLEMPDGRILIVYYTEGAGSDIRYAFLRMTAEGPELLGRTETQP